MSPSQKDKRAAEKIAALQSKREKLTAMLPPYRPTDPNEHLSTEAMLHPDFDQEYGVLSYAVQDIQAAGTNLTPTLQNWLGDQRAKAYQGEFNAYQARGGTRDIDEFYNDPWSHAAVNSLPLDVSRISRQTIHEYGKTVEQLYPDFAKIDTIGKASDYLHGSVLKGILGSAGQLANNPLREADKWVPLEQRNQFGDPQAQVSSGFNQDLSATNSTMFLGYVENSWRYDASKGPYLTFAMRAGNTAAVEERRKDINDNLFRGSSLDTGGSSQDGETGDTYEHNSAADMGQSMSDIGNVGPAWSPGIDPSSPIRSMVKNPMGFYRDQIKEIKAGGKVTPGRGDYVIPFEVAENTPAAVAGLSKGGTFWGVQGLFDLAHGNVPDNMPQREAEIAIAGAQQAIFDFADAAESGKSLNFITSAFPGDLPRQSTITGGYFPGSYVEGEEFSWHEKIARKMELASAGTEFRQQIEDGQAVSLLPDKEERYPTALFTPRYYQNNVTRAFKNGNVRFAPLSTEKKAGYAQANISASDVRNIGRISDQYSVEGETIPDKYKDSFKLLRRAANAVDASLGSGGGNREPDTADNMQELSDILDSAEHREEVGFSSLPLGSSSKGSKSPRSKRFAEELRAIVGEVPPLPKTYRKPQNLLPGSQALLEKSDPVYSEFRRNPNAPKMKDAQGKPIREDWSYRKEEGKVPFLNYRNLMEADLADYRYSVEHNIVEPPPSASGDFTDTLMRHREPGKIARAVAAEQAQNPSPTSEVGPARDIAPSLGGYDVSEPEMEAFALDPIMQERNYLDAVAEEGKRPEELTDRVLAGKQQANYQEAVSSIDQGDPGARWMAVAAPLGFRAPVVDRNTKEVVRNKEGNPVMGGISLSETNPPEVQETSAYVQKMMDKDEAFWGVASETLRKTNPSLYARAKYVGHRADEKKDSEFGANISVTSSTMGVPLAFDPKHPEQFAKDFYQLEQKDPRAAEIFRLAANMPDEGQAAANLEKLQRQGQLPSSVAQDTLVRRSKIQSARKAAKKKAVVAEAPTGEESIFAEETDLVPPEDPPTPEFTSERLASSSPEPKRSSGPGGIVAHGYNGSIYGVMGMASGSSGIGDPEMGMSLETDDSRRLRSHNITGGPGNGSGGGNLMPNRVIMGDPGTGKTHEQVDYARAQGHVNPSEKLFLSATRTARDVFKSRVEQVTQFGSNIRSFHGLGLRVMKSLSEYGYGTVSQGGEIPDVFGPESVLPAMGNYAMTGSILSQMAGTPGVQPREVDNRYNPHFTDQVKKYGDAAELYRSSLLSEADYDTEEFQDFTKEQGLNPEIFKTYFSEAGKQLRTDQKVTMSELLSIPARFLDANPNTSGMLKGFKYIAVDEWNQVGKAARSLFSHLRRQNPHSTYSISGDKNQASMWSFLRPVQDAFGKIARELGVVPETLDKNYRLPPELVSAVGNLTETPVGQRSVSQLASNPNVVERSVKGFHNEDEYAQLTSDIQNDITVGKKDPAEMMILASKRKQLEAIQSSAASQGLNVWVNPSEEKYLDQVFSGHMTWEDAEIKMQEEAASRPEGSVEARTYHAAQGSQAEHVYAEVSANNFRGDTEEDRKASAEKLAVGISRVNGQHGSLSLYSSTEEGGRTPLVDQAFNGTGAVIPSILTPEAAANSAPVSARANAASGNKWAFGSSPVGPGSANPSLSHSQHIGNSPSVNQAGQPTPPGRIQIPARALTNPIAFASLSNGMKSDSWPVRGYSSPTIGSYTTDAQGDGLFMKNGNMTVTPEAVKKSTALAQEAWNHAFNSGPMPTGDANDFAATLRSRINKFLLSYVKEVEGRVRGTPNEMEERTMAAHVKELAGQQTDEKLGAINHVLGTNRTDITRTSHGSTGRAKTQEQLDQIKNADPAIAGKLAGVDETELLQGEDTILTGDYGSYTFGGKGGGGSSRSTSSSRSGNGYWSGKLGKALYGLYLTKRMWNMTAGPGEAEAERYEQGIGNEYERAAAFGGGTADNRASRQSVTQERAQLAASQVYGGLSDVGYVLSPNGGLSRTGQYLGLGMGLGSTVYMGAQVGEQMKMISPETAGKLGKVGMFVGAETMTLGVGMEVYNQLFQQGRPVMSIGGAGQDLAAGMATLRARGEYNQKTTGNTTSIRSGAPAMRGGNLGPYQVAEPTAEDLWDQLRPEEKAVITASTRRWMGGDTGAERLRGLNDLLSTNAYETVEQSAAGNSILHQVFGDDYSDAMAQAFGSQAARLGVGTQGLSSGAVQYASQSGAKRGTNAFQQLFDAFAYKNDLGEQDTLSFVAGRQSQLGNQLQALMPANSTYENLGVNMAKTMSIPQIYNASSAITGYQSFNGTASPTMMQNLGYAAGRMNQYVGGVVSDAASALSVQGVNYASSYGLLSQAGMTNQQADVFSSYMNGDMGRMSWEGWKTGNPAFRLQDQSGRSVFETNGGAALETMAYWARNKDQFVAGSGSFLNGFPFSGNKNAQASWMFGFDNNNLSPLQSEINDAYISGGTRDVGLLQNQKSYDAQMASAGIQSAGIALQENYLWGSKAGGSWDNPTTGSSWGIENRQLALSQRSQQADFTEQQRRMVSQNQYAIQSENISLQRMNTSNAYNNWQTGFNYQGFQQQEAWTRQSWGLQDQSTAMQNSWSMEDINDAIRYSSGRDRRKLITQRDRMTATQNLQAEGTDNARSNQETTWARQEEQYRKQEQYSLELQKLDRDSFDLGKRQRQDSYKMDSEQWKRKKAEYEEGQKLDEEARKLSREYQHDQIDLQKASAGLQAQQAAEQKVFADALVKAEKPTQMLAGTLANMEKYEGAFRSMNALQNLMWSANNLDVYKINALIELIKEAGNGQTNPLFDGWSLDQYGPNNP